MKRLIQHYLHSHSQFAQFLRFATVGIKISLIDAAGVYLLPILFGMNLYVARIFSLGAAIMVGYLLNRYFTFGGQRRGCFYRQMAGHFGVHLTGGLINYGVFSATIAAGHEVLDNVVALWLLPLAALWAGGMIGLGFNFVFSRKLVFSPKPDKADQPS